MITQSGVMLMGHVGIGGLFNMKPIFLKCLLGVPILLTGLIILLILPPIGKHYRIPSVSMAPTLIPGDIVYASNYAYTFTDDKTPPRGKIIIFKRENSNISFVTRVIGLPGDKVQLRAGRLYLNDMLVERVPQGDRLLKQNVTKKTFNLSLYEEQLTQDTQVFQIFEENDRSSLDNTPVFHVPKEHIFVLGDNRDNSIDSRIPITRMGVGYVPLKNIIGEVEYILIPSKSCKNDKGLFCPKRGFLQKP